MTGKNRHRVKVISDYVTNLAIRFLITGALALPYRMRVPLVGFVASRIIAPLAGYRSRIRSNLKYIFPDMAPAEIARIVRGVPDNMGRTLIEIYSGKEFSDRVRDLPLLGKGAKALETAHAASRPVILVTGHFGNYDVPRAGLLARGYHVGALYRPMQNAFFNAHYEIAIAGIGEPVFARGKRGFGQLIRFIRSGGMAGFLVDQHMANGADLSFFGKPAATALSAAELAIKYDALLVPIYGIRRANGLDFDIVVEAPI
ncbi:MAG: lysophospholipid acyltransferase family protein, partial [Paracoccaceae bacterium]